MSEKVILKGGRFIVVDDETGEVLDDAQGYGYTTAQKAYKGYYYKKNHKAIEEKNKELSRTVEEWLKENPSFNREIENVIFISLKEDNPSIVNDFFKECNAPFSVKEYDKYLKYKSTQRKRKKRKKQAHRDEDDYYGISDNFPCLS